MTLYELYLINDLWTANIFLTIVNGRTIEFIKAGNIFESKFKDCKALHFKGDMVKI